MGFARCDALIGIEVPRDEIRRIFEALEFGVVEQSDTQITVDIPSFRNDLTREVDLIEEVARMYGLDKIPAPAPRAELVPGADDTPYRAERALREKLVGLGLFQAMNYKLTSPALLDALDPDNAAARIVLPNPMSSERSILRTSLLPQMVESLARNHTRQVTEAALFELGPAFSKSGEGADETYTQHNRVAIGLLGPIARAGLDKMTPISGEEQFFALKGIVEQLGAITCKAATDPVFESGAELVFRGNVIGKIGVVSRKIRTGRVGKDKWRMLDPIAVAEFDYEPLLSGFGKVVKPKTISEFPASRRDAALVLDASVTHEQVVKVIKKAAPNELVALDLFDVYQGDKLPEGKKSLAFRLTYQAPDRTLKDEECTVFQNTIKASLRKQLGAEVPEDA